MNGFLFVCKFYLRGFDTQRIKYKMKKTALLEIVTITCGDIKSCGRFTELVSKALLDEIFASYTNGLSLSFCLQMRVFYQRGFDSQRLKHLQNDMFVFGISYDLLLKKLQ